MSGLALSWPLAGSAGGGAARRIRDVLQAMYIAGLDLTAFSSELALSCMNEGLDLDDRDKGDGK